MFDDVRDLVKGQQPNIDKMTNNIERTRNHVELVCSSLHGSLVVFDDVVDIIHYVHCVDIGGS
jgi:hypothetical protein